MPSKQERICYCDFCGENQHKVELMIAGPEDNFICNECVGLCNDIIAEKRAEKAEVANINEKKEQA